jgi:MYXO-CTERM domain-containing protein
LRLAFALAFSLCVAGAARATTFTLNVEFDNGTVGTFGSVEVTEIAGGDLLFELSVDAGALGPGSDLHEFYFNLPSAITGVSITSTDVVTTAYELLVAPPPAGGAGSSFAYGVSFGNGAGPKGNDVLQDASFVLAAGVDLAIADLLIGSHVNSGFDVYFAAHVQGTSLLGETSETVGSQVPEPGTLVLGALGLLGLAAVSRRRERPAT